MNKYLITIKQANERLDKFLVKKLFGFTRNQIQKMIKNNIVFVNKKEVASNYILKDGDEVCVKNLLKENNDKLLDLARNSLIFSNKIMCKIKVIFKTNEYIILYKPAGLIVHGAEHIKEKTLVDWLLNKYPNIAKVGDDSARPGIVHRLDKDVSGIIVVALTQESFENLKKQFMERKIEKEYMALVYKKVDKNYDKINFSIKRSSCGHRMAAMPIGFVGDKNVRNAITEFKIEKKFINYTLLKVKIKTGRTHQIRVHMFAYGHPVVGDYLYFTKKTKEKNKKLKLNRVFLEATRLCFVDLSGEKKCFKISLDNEFKELLKIVK